LSNLYFDWPAESAADRFVRFDTVRAEDVNAAFDEVSAGFEKMPTPTQMWGGSQNYSADTGSANTHVVSVAATHLTGYYAGMKVKFKAANTNTGAATLNVNSLGAKAIVRPDGATALTAGAIVAGQMVEATYDGTNFQMATSASVTWSNDPSAIQRQSYIAFTTGGSGTAYTLTPTPALTSYAAGVSFSVTFHAASGAAPTLEISGLATPPNLVRRLEDGSYTNIAANDIPANHVARVTLLSPTQALVESLPPVAANPAAINGFRLSLVSGNAVGSSGAASTLYCVPYKGERIALFNGTVWRAYASAQFSLALSGLTANRPYDVFVYANAGVPTLEVLAWTSDTTRATALVYQDGVLVKSGATTRRYVGTFYATAATTTEDSAANRYLWNNDNRIPRSIRKAGNATTWTYTSATVRQANASTSNQINMVIGLQEDPIQIGLLTLAAGGPAVNILIGVGIDTTTSLTEGTSPGVDSVKNNPVGINYTQEPLAPGRHYIAWLEASNGGTTVTFNGQTSCPGLFGSVMA
jgi:hypothetical protein